MLEKQRSIDIDKIDSDTLIELSSSISQKLKVIMDDAISESNKILNIYGLQVKVHVAFDAIEK